MNTLIAYASRHGCTQEVVRELSEQLGGEVSTCRLGKDQPPDPAGFDAVIIGGSIHAGQLQSQVRKFMLRHLETLQSRSLGLFLCHMESGEKAKSQFEKAFPETLRTHAKASGLFGGVFNLSRMNFLERAVVKKVAGVTDTVDRVDHEAIRLFAESIQAKA